MPGPAYSRLHLDERRRQLLDAGAALFAEHAFEEISMRQIAEAAGVSKALLYHYFPSKLPCPADIRGRVKWGVMCASPVDALLFLVPVRPSLVWCRGLPRDPGLLL